MAIHWSKQMSRIHRWPDVTEKSEAHQSCASKWNFPIISDFGSLNFEDDIASFQNLQSRIEIGKSAIHVYMCIKTPCTTSRDCEIELWSFEGQNHPQTQVLSCNLRSTYFHIIFYKTKKHHTNFNFFVCALLAGDAGSTLRMRIPLCPLFRPSAIRILSAVNSAFRVKMSSERRNHNRRIAIIWQESESCPSGSKLLLIYLQDVVRFESENHLKSDSVKHHFLSVVFSRFS